jgi:8-oxo-dGTP diphosphatase
MSFLQSLRFGMRLLINKRTIAGACAIIKNSKGEILLGKRAKDSLTYPDFWGLPGGIIEYGETIKDTIKREIKEELGINSKFIRYGKPAVQLPAKDSPFHYLSIIAYCSVKEKPLAKDETSEVRWFKPKEIKNMKLAYNHKEILKNEKII